MNPRSLSERLDQDFHGLGLLDSTGYRNGGPCISIECPQQVKPNKFRLS